MAYTTINKSTDYFNTLLYTGTGSSSTKSGVGFQPDLTWVKARDNTTWHYLYDAVRTAGSDKEIHSNSNQAQGQSDGSTYGYLSAFTSDGFSTVMGSNTGSDGFNKSGTNFVAWNWKAGTTGSGNTGGSGTAKAYSYSVNTTAGFSIVKYIGNGNAAQTVPHHLGTTPAMVIVKNLDATADGWMVYHKKLTSGKGLVLNNTNKEYDASASGLQKGINGVPTSTNLTFVSGYASQLSVNANDNNYIAYCFAEKTGYSKFGSYVANDQDGANSPFIYTGFKPKFLLIKNIIDETSSSDWVITDSKRPGYNPTNDKIFANENQVEATDEIANLLSNGFKLDNSTTDLNYSTRTYVYAAFGQSLVGSNNVPCVGG